MHKVIPYILLVLIVYYLWLINKETFSESPKVAYITAVFGDYEATCKNYVSQTIPSDFIIFTNNQNIINTCKSWIVDTTPYHLTHPNPLDTGNLINSLSNNKHTFNVAKYYKQSFHLIPRLKNYDIIVWLDGTIEITRDDVSSYLLNIFKENKGDLVSMDLSGRNGILKNEVVVSNMDRYTSTFWNGQEQPYQDVNKQYDEYIKQGYSDDKWPGDYGVWITCFVAFNMLNKKTIPFLDFWYKQTLEHTTQDQIGFPFAMQKLNINPYTLPDDNIKGDPGTVTNIYIKHEHGK